METRKIQKVGYSTLTVSLPRKWVKEWKLEHGDSITIIPETDGSLRLAASSIDHDGSGGSEYVMDSDLCADKGMLMRMTIANYVLGRDSYRIVASNRMDSGHMEEVRATARRLIGLSIIEESSDRVMIQCSIDPSKFNILSLIRRLSIIALTMLDEAMQTLETGDPSFAKDAIRRENEVDMMHRLSSRLLGSAQEDRFLAEKIGITDPRRILGNILVSKYLELVADQAEGVARRVLEIEKFRGAINAADIATILSLGKLTYGIIQDAVDCFLMENLEKANKVLESREIMGMEERRFSSSVPSSIAIVQGLAMIAEKGAGIAEVAFDRSLLRDSRFCRLYDSTAERAQGGS